MSEVQAGTGSTCPNMRVTSWLPFQSLMIGVTECQFALLMMEATLLGGKAEPFDGESRAAEMAPPFVKYPGMVTVECVDDGVFGYLQLANTSDEGPRTDDVGGDLFRSGECT